MPIIVAGMPAAGTGLAAECLKLSGLRLVDDCGTPPAGPCRDAVPPEPWGWVDGRGSLELPLWLASHPVTRAVVCIRHPFEVAVSLRDRCGVSLAVGLTLWRTHACGVLDTTTVHDRVIAHFGAYRHEVGMEAARVAAAVGLDPSASILDACRRAWRAGPSRPRFAMDDLVDQGVDPVLIDAYQCLCDEACHADDQQGSVRPPRHLVRELADASRQMPASNSTLHQTLSLLQEEVARVRHELATRDDELCKLLDDLRHDVEDDRLPPQKRLYRRTIRQIRNLVKTHVPGDGIVAIVSKGDEELMRQQSCEAWHFPRDDKGGYLGYHPAGDLAAIANLETCRARGATHFLVPETHAWWLTTYPGLSRHLERHARLIEARAGAGTLYDLATSKPFAASIDERLTAALGRPAHVLQWNAPRAAAIVPSAEVFAAPTAMDRLPYIDKSIDVVAVAHPTVGMLAEARRVASLAVVDVAAEPTVEWLRRPLVAEPPSVSIVLPAHNQWPITKACLRAVLSSLPADWPVEVLVIDDASTDETPRRLTELTNTDHRLVILRNDSNLGFVGTCNRGAAAATGAYLVFLNNDTVTLPGWLPPLIRTFHDFPNTAAVGGKLLFPDGRLQEAGGIIFADGSPCHFGREHPDPAWHLFNHVRSVDYVSGALLATPRELFAACGGFDPEFAPGYYEDTDYCFRLREQGYEIRFQPASVVVHVEGGTAGTDQSIGMKRFQEINRCRFQARHAAALMRQPLRPAVIDRGTWAALAHRGLVVEHP